MVASETAARIASAALAILLDEGAQAVSMRRVATAAGVTAMAVYRHFPNREALLRSVVDTSVAELTRDWGKRRPAADFMARLDGLADDFLDFALGKPNLYLYLVTERRENPRQFPDGFRTGGSPAFAPVHAAVEQGMRDGVLRDDDALEAALAITTPVIGLVQLYLGGRINLTEHEFRLLCKRTVGRTLDGLTA